MKQQKTMICGWICTMATAMVMTACVTPKNYNYLQDLQSGSVTTTPASGYIRMQPKDEISILVKSNSAELDALFNKGMTTTMSNGNAQGSQYVEGYRLDANGNIDFPQLGTIHLAGMRRSEVENYIKTRLEEEGLLKHATVTVGFRNLSYTVMGEVKDAGEYSIDKDEVTLLEALGKAGDLTVYGRRDSVVVVRNDGERHTTLMADLTRGKALHESEAYYVHQNDLIYVKANPTKIRQSTTNGNETRSMSLWISIASILASLAGLITR